MPRFLIHIHTGPENPKAALGFVAAATAVKEGHKVDLFLAGDGVSLLGPEAVQGIEGKGTRKLSAHLESIISGGGKFYLSGMSAKARGLDEAVLKDRPAEFASPTCSPASPPRPM